MTIQQARRQLSHEEMSKVTEHALATGPFSIEKVAKKADRVEVTVRFPELDKKSIIIL